VVHEDLGVTAPNHITPLLTGFLDIMGCVSTQAPVVDGGAMFMHAWTGPYAYGLCREGKIHSIVGVGGRLMPCMQIL
jgi:hypothetical protein